MKNRFFKGGTKNHKTTKKPDHTSNSVILSIEKFRLSLKPEPMRRIPTARIGIGCIIGAWPVYRKRPSSTPSAADSSRARGHLFFPAWPSGSLAMQTALQWRSSLIARDDILGVPNQRLFPEERIQISSHRGTRFVRPRIHISQIIRSAAACIPSQGEAGPIRKRETRKKHPSAGCFFHGNHVHWICFSLGLS